jgi:hypothetical protein
MMSSNYYLIRSKSDGRYLAARPDEQSSYLLLFREDFEALSYLNTHAGELASRLAVELVADSHLGDLIKRWGFVGVGLVSDPLVPTIEFARRN